MVKNSSRVRGVFIDLDGTLAGSLLVLRKAYDRFLLLHGKKGHTEEFESLNGPTLREIVARLHTKYGLAESPDDLLARYEALIDEAYLEAPPMKHALDFVEEARASGWWVAVVTSNSESRARAWLQHHGFADLVDDVVSGESVSRGKPAPDIYRFALTRAEVDPASSIAVEDGRHGAQAAVAAGLRTFVCTGEPGSRSDWPVEIKFVSDFAQLISLLKHDFPAAA